MSRSAIVTLALGGVAFTLHGCGSSNGNDRMPTPAPTPAPTPMPVSVLSYNLEWWILTKGVYNITDVHATIKANGPFDLMGFQECENVSSVVGGLEGHWGTIQLWDGPHDIGVAWNADKFTNVSHGFAETGKDAYWTRQMQWVRLQIKGTDNHVFFANVHGAMAHCNGTGGEEVSADYDRTISENKKDGDHVFFTGDFNCQDYDDVIKRLGKQFNDSAQATHYWKGMYHPDHIFTSSSTKTVNSTGICCREPGHCFGELSATAAKYWPAGYCPAAPSDHALLKGHYVLPAGDAVDASMAVVV